MSCYDCAKAEGHELECPRHERNAAKVEWRNRVIEAPPPSDFAFSVETAGSSLDYNKRVWPASLKNVETSQLEEQLQDCADRGNNTCPWCPAIREVLAERKARAARDGAIGAVERAVKEAGLTEMDDSYQARAAKQAERLLASDIDQKPRGPSVRASWWTTLQKELGTGVEEWLNKLKNLRLSSSPDDVRCVFGFDN